MMSVAVEIGLSRFSEGKTGGREWMTEGSANTQMSSSIMLSSQSGGYLRMQRRDHAPVRFWPAIRAR